MPGSPGVISDTLIYQIAQSVPPPISTFLLTSETKAEDIIAHYKRVQTSTIQLVDAVEEVIRISKFVDTILLDSGTGRTHDWELSRAIRTSISIPLFLAGGLNKDNVQHAIETVKPFGLDLCNSVRTNGNLDPKKNTRFFKAVR